MINFKKRLLFFTSVFLALNTFLNSQSVIKLPKTEIPKTEKRRQLTALFQNEIAQAAGAEAEKNASGDWKGIIESALFMLIRRTEIYRGRMRLIIADTGKAKCRIYPDGTIVISTTLLDYIDTSLFTASGSSARRIKNFNAERENFIAPIVAFEAARFALDLDVNYLFMKTGIKKLPESAVFSADEFSLALLKTAGYRTSLAENFFQELKTIQRDKNNAEAFSFFFENFPSPDKRLSRIITAKAGAEKLGEELSNILSELQMQKGISDAKQSIAALKASYPAGLYFPRLEALAAHSLWLESAFEEISSGKAGQTDSLKFLMPVIPAAISKYPYAKNYYSFLEPAPAKLKAGMTDSAAVIGNMELFLRALKAYEEYNSVISEAQAQSAYATLLARSANTHDKTTAAKIAEEAALQEQNSQSETAQINCAAVLFLTMRDVTKARGILKELVHGKKHSRDSWLFLHEGKCFDERILLFDYALMLYALGETAKAEQAKNMLKVKFFAENEAAKNGGIMSLRKFTVGSSIDELVEKWGRPSFIIYNYFSERWFYDGLGAEIIVSNDEKSPHAVQINIMPESTVSLPGDIRVGDNRRAFEKVFGKPVYFAADCEVYFYNGAQLFVLYSGSVIKHISVSKDF